MRKLQEELNQLCSVPEYKYSFYDGAPIIRNEYHGFSYLIEFLKSGEKEIVARLPFLKLRKISPKLLFGELKEEINRNFSENSVNAGYENPGKINQFSIRMPHHPEEKCYENLGYFCSIKISGDKMALCMDQIDVDLYTDLPYNIFYTFLFGVLMSHLYKKEFAGCVLDFQNGYVRKEDLPHVKKIIESDIELDTVHVRIKQPFSNLDEVTYENLEIVISWFPTKKQYVNPCTAFCYYVNFLDYFS